MSDEHPLDEIELLKAARDLARIVREFYASLVEQGFSPAAALQLTGHYLHGIVGGKQA